VLVRSSLEPAAEAVAGTFIHCALAALLLGLTTGISASADQTESDERRSINKGVDLRSRGRQIADEVRQQRQVVPFRATDRGDLESTGWRKQDDRREEEGRRENDDGREKDDRHEKRDRRENEDLDVQANNPALDFLQTFPGTRPFEFSTQSETSIAAFRDNIVIGYNSTTDQPLVQSGGGLLFRHIHVSAFSVSHDGGRTWTSGFVPPVAGSPFTFGDPTVGVDRAGRFYYVSLGTDANAPIFTGAVIMNTSTDGGATFAPATIVARDDGSDKPWLAVGRDPADGKRDNLYVVWTSFQPDHAELRLARSIDGGVTWSAQKTLFIPVDTGPGGLTALVQFANPTVDQSTGRLFIPFLHLSDVDTDFIKVLVSDDAGETFRFLEFNVAGAPDTAGFPNVTPGTLSDCGTNGGVRPVLSQGANLGGGRFGLPRFRQATRLITQPSAAAANGKLFIAFNSSTSPLFGDPNSRSEIHLLFSPDGGRRFFGPFAVAVATDADPQHVLPSVSVDREGQHASVAYYVQQADGKIRVDLTTADIRRERHFRTSPPVRLSNVSFDLVPSNNPVPNVFNQFLTTNYDQAVVACYNLGEYLSITHVSGGVLAAWGDNRNQWTSPPGSPIVGSHAQADVFFLQVERVPRRELER